MGDILKNAQPIWKRTWFRYLGAFFIVQLLFTPHYRAVRPPPQNSAKAKKLGGGINCP
ncbi:hypothetical protein P9Z56_26410 [Bacillus cereus]|nr:hypothetical protein [Bacillus cereus]MEC2745885.1 hypothetical protein [Bacillus cereus]MEC2757202.1 hypothetical protein [Bacillus cereus]MEC2829688.1 hypothetical protein [Bacillus cereus]